ncbi:MAG: hypothetical protein KDC38_16680, partial [Planctomycetes bacterium]|nr:hypothetical protein [Planctomycetota bacterium]
MTRRLVAPSLRVVTAGLLTTVLTFATLWNAFGQAEAPEKPAKPERPTANDWSRSPRYAVRGDARKFSRDGGGGTVNTVKQALAWLVRHQAPDGRWSSSDCLKQCAKPDKPCAN